jgi:hypothetical protein
MFGLVCLQEAASAILKVAISHNSSQPLRTAGTGHPQVRGGKPLPEIFHNRINLTSSYILLGVIREEFVDPGSRFNPGFLGYCRIENFLLMNTEAGILVENFHRRGQALKLTINFLGKSPCISLGFSDRD